MLEIKCPKCSESNFYLFCDKCNTFYCMTCCINFYEDNHTNNILINHNPICDASSESSIDLSDYE